MAPEDDTSDAGHMGEQIPLETGDGGIFNSASSRIQFRRPIRLGNQASSLLEKKEVHRF